MAKTKNPAGSGSARSATSSGSPSSEVDRERMIAEAAYYRAMLRGFANGDPADDWLAAEREINRLLPSPSQQKSEMATYQKLRAEVQKLLAETKETLSADTLRQTLDDTRERLRQAGEYTADSIDKAITSIEKEMLGAGKRVGARLENLSERTADFFYIWRDRSSRFLADAASALGDWAQEVSTRLGQPTYRTGDIAASGELECTSCGEHVLLQTSAHVPLCPKCRKTEFRRIS